MSTRRMATSDSVRDIGQAPGLAAMLAALALIVAEAVGIRKGLAHSWTANALAPAGRAPCRPNSCAILHKFATACKARGTSRLSPCNPLFPVLRRPTIGRQA